MPLFPKFLVGLVTLTAASALAADAPRVDPPSWFEPLDHANSHWTIRGSSQLADLSAAGMKLVRRSSEVLNVTFIGESTSAVVRGEQPLGARSYYFRGRDPQKWRRAVPHFNKVRAVGVYPGIDALYYQGPHGLEADFIVSANADITLIELQFENRRITLDRQGDLCDKASGEVLLAAPYAYEVDENNNRKLVPSRFRLLASNRAGFRVEREDPSRTLVIDPVLSFATYLGGSGRDTIVSIERGADGRIYVAGNTTSVDLPQAVSLSFFGELIRPVVLPSEDTFVACYSPDGSTLLYTVYVGGSARDLATSLAVDSQGRPTVVGYTYSMANFPITPNTSRQLSTQAFDAFAYRLTADGSALEYSVFLNIVSSSYGYLAATNSLTFLVGVDASGAASVGGPAPSFNGNNEIGVAPAPGTFQTKPAGGNDIFLMRLTPDGLGIQWSTYYGGTHDENLMAMAVDPGGNVLLAGTTNSNDLPLMRPFQAAPPTVYTSTPLYNSATAGFFARFASNGGSITSASYFGGQSKNSSLNSVALDDTGAIYLAGSSAVSAAPGLSEIPGPPSTYAWSSPGVIIKLDTTGSTPQYMWAYSVLSAGDVRRIRVDASHHPCILTNFLHAPTLVGALPTNLGYPGFGFACFGDDGKTVAFATMPPGNGSVSTIVDFAIDPDGTLIGASNIPGGAGGTPPTTASAPQPAPGGGNVNGYVFKIQPDNPVPQLFYVSPPLIFTPTNSNFSTLTLLGANFAPGATVLWNGAPVTLTNPSGTYNSTSISGSLASATLNTLPKGDAQIQVSMPGPGGGISNPVTIKYVNPAPTAISITPSVVPVGNGATTFTVTGALAPDCAITLNGAPQTIVPGAGSSFQFTAPASFFATAGDIVVVASNPAPGGGSVTAHVSVTGNGLPFPSVTGPVVVGIGQGGVAQKLSVNFAPDDAVVVWNGSDRPTSRVNSTTLQFVLSLNDVTQMGSAQLQIRRGGVLGPAITAFIGFPAPNTLLRGDPDRGLAYFAGGTNGQILEAVAIPAGTVVRMVDLGARIQSFSITDDKMYLWVTTANGQISRVNVDTFSIDMTGNVPISQASTSSPSALSAIPVAGTSSTIVASGTDAVLRILDGGQQRGFSSADLFPAAPSSLIPVFATADTVWAKIGNNPIASCLVRLPYDYTGFESFATSCNNGLDLTGDEVKLDAGVVYFQSGSDTLVWNSPRGGYVDFSRRRIIAQAGSKVATYDLDSEALVGTVPESGTLPFGVLFPYGGSQALLSISNMLLLIDLP